MVYTWRSNCFSKWDWFNTQIFFGWRNTSFCWNFQKFLFTSTHFQCCVASFEFFFRFRTFFAPPFWKRKTFLWRNCASFQEQQWLKLTKLEQWKTRCSKIKIKDVNFTFLPFFFFFCWCIFGRFSDSSFLEQHPDFEKNWQPENGEIDTEIEMRHMIQWCNFHLLKQFN